MGFFSGECVMESKSLLARIKETFLEDKGMKDVKAEWEKLTEADREWFAAQFNKAGLPTVFTSQTPAKKAA